VDTLAAIQARRAVKHYDPDHQLPAEDLDQILAAAMAAPTAFNIQRWRFVVVVEPGLRQESRSNAWVQAQVTDASTWIILVGDEQGWNKDPNRYWRNAPEAVQGFLVPAIGQYYEGKPDVQRDEVMRSCGLAGMNIMLAAKALGYDSCPMDGFDFDAVGKLINLPDDHRISFMIAIGKGTVEPWPKPGQLSRDEVVIDNRF